MLLDITTILDFTGLSCPGSITGLARTGASFTTAFFPKGSLHFPIRHHSESRATLSSPTFFKHSMATSPFSRTPSSNQMNLKRSPVKELEKKVSSPYQAKTKRHSSKSSSTSSETSLPLASAPRTVEIMWGGYTAPGFTLKRRRTGAILVSTVTQETEMSTTVKVGSELKLVGGFPVNRLTLKDIKKVMLMAPKPVSLVFINTDDVVIGNVNELSIEKKLLYSLTDDKSPTSTTSSEDSGETSDSDKSFMTTSTFYSETSETNKSKKRKVSKLQVALVHVNQLLNRPVRQAGLHIAVGKSIVV